MHTEVPYWANALLYVVGGTLAFYAFFIALAAIPYFQRHFIYGHKINSLYWYDVNKPEQWGFATNQVTPFRLSRKEDENIYAWHILPLLAYAKNEEALIKQPRGFRKNFAFDSVLAFRLLKEDRNAKVVINFHGNAGHLAQNTRSKTFHLLAAAGYHVFSIDYRGFGHTPGIPTEEGLVDDGAAVVDFVLNQVGIAPSRVVILGQSLGTAVASAVAERYASLDVEFAGIVLVAGISYFPSMLGGYRIGGFIGPILGPFRWMGTSRWIEGYVVDEWPSAARLSRMIKATRRRARISLVHAWNDWDIPCSESDLLFEAVARATLDEKLDAKTFEAWKASRTEKLDNGVSLTTWKADRLDVVIKQTMFPHGGHNNVSAYAPVQLAVMGCFPTS